MSLGDDTHDGGEADREGSGPTGPNRTPGDMGQALRGVYQKTIEEAIPDEMLDLLGKLD